MLSVRKSCLVVLALAAPLPAAGAERDEAWLRQRIKEIKASDPTGWRTIPWVPSLPAARRAAARERRPIFVFTHDGNIDTGRC
jgi:hypothetical protein